MKLIAYYSGDFRHNINRSSNDEVVPAGNRASCAVSPAHYYAAAYQEAYFNTRPHLLLFDHFSLNL